MKIGSFVSFKSPNYLIGSYNESINNDANAMMIYLGAPQTSKRSNPKNWKIEEFKKINNQIDIADVVVHAPYIINLSSFDKSNFAVDFLINEIELMNKIGAKLLVVHPGSSLNQDVNETLIFLANNINKIISKTKEVIIVIETMSGKGTQVCNSFEEIKKVIDIVENKERIGICIDTCHIWDYGYNIKDDFENNNGTMLSDVLEKNKLSNFVKVIHLNDSLNECGSKKDRHANIGQGKIGLKALKNFINFPLFKNIPIILETPFIDEQIYKKEIELLKK